MTEFQDWIYGVVAGIFPTVVFYSYWMQYNIGDTFSLRRTLQEEGINPTTSRRISTWVFQRQFFSTLLFLAFANNVIIWLQYGDIKVHLFTLLPMFIFCAIGYGGRRESWIPWAGIFGTVIIGGHLGFFLSPTNSIISFVIGVTITIPITIILYHIVRRRFVREMMA